MGSFGILVKQGYLDISYTSSDSRQKASFGTRHVKYPDLVHYTNVRSCVAEANNLLSGGRLMTELNESDLVDEILSALDTAGEIESWIDQHMLGPGCGDLLVETYRQMTQHLLGMDPPMTGRWEHLLFATAARSTKSNPQRSCEACKTAIVELTLMIDGDRFATTVPEHMVTLASTLTMVLSAQRRLRQPIEVATKTLHEKFPELMSVMAERCQDIWQRYGQMSGLVGLYFWDNRNNEWRLQQDFKPHRPE